MKTTTAVNLALAALLTAVGFCHTASADEKKLADLAYGGDEAQRMDVYIPPEPHDAPIIMMVHGGAWIFGDKGMSRMYENKAAHWLPKGYIFISVNYRLVPHANPLQQAEDVATALAKVQTEAASWGGDPKRVILIGHSAGAHLVALLAANPELAYRAGAKPWLGTVALDSGALNVPEIMARKHYSFYDRAFGDKPDFWRAVSPTLQLTAQATPLMLVCSSRRDDSCPPNEDFAKRAKALGVPVTFETEDMTHREINEDLGLDSAYTASVDAFIAPLVARGE
jgi:acetyl esterase/lipase